MSAKPAHTFELNDGVQIDGEAHVDVGLRNLNGQEYANCLENAEKLVMAPIGFDDNEMPITEPTFVASPARMALLVLRTRTTHIGPIHAPIPDNVWDKLSPTDMNIMLAESDKLDAASFEVARRGRDDSASGADS